LVPVKSATAYCSQPCFEARAHRRQEMCRKRKKQAAEKRTEKDDEES